MNAIIQALDPVSLLFLLSFTPWGFGFAFYGFQLPLIINLLWKHKVRVRSIYMKVDVNTD